MTNKQSNFVAMTMAVQKVFAKYQAEVDSLAAFAKEATIFNTNQETIREVLQVQQGKITGISVQKQKEEAEMIEATVRLAAAGYVYALDNNNFELLEKVRINGYELEKMPQTKLLATCSVLLAETQKIEGDLTEYGIKSEDTISLAKEINDYADLLANPRAAIVTRSQATSRLADLIQEQRMLLNKKADKLMLMFKSSNSPFYNEYKSARIIVDMGTRHRSTEIED